MSNWDYELVLYGSREAYRLAWYEIQLEETEDEQLRIWIKEQIEAISQDEPYKYYKQWVEYENALDYASK